MTLPTSLISGLNRFRRQATLSTVRAALAYGAKLSPERTVSFGRSAGRLTGMLPPLRQRLKTNFRLAGFEPTPDRVDRYFRLLGNWFYSSLSTYNRGFADCGYADCVRFDETISHLDRAMSGGRGAVLVSPHAFCHEFAAAAINRRHPVVALVRESKNPVRDAIKRRWYEATGLEVVRRSRKASMLFDVMDYVRVLQSGKVLAITPDLPVPANQGVPVTLLGKQVSLNPGMIALSMWSGAPLVFCWPRKWEFAGARADTATIYFDEPLSIPMTRDRNAAMRSGMAEWTRRLEECLRRNPEYWLFWLDKRWTHVWRGER